MLIMMIHEYKLCRGVTAKLCFDLEIKYGSMVVNLPVPSLLCESGRSSNDAGIQFPVRKQRDKRSLSQDIWTPLQKRRWNPARM